MWVPRGTPAHRLKIGIGDVVVEFDGLAVKDPGDMATRLRDLRPGDEVKLVWNDVDGVRHTGTAVLDAGPPG